MAKQKAFLFPALIDRHNGRRRLLRHIAHSMFFRAGGFRSYTNIDWERVERLVLVCSGNICRSPYAEARARSLGIPAASFGLQATLGASADAAAIRAAATHGIDLIAHRTRRAVDVHLRDNDLLIAMEPWQAERLAGCVFTMQVQITLQGLWAKTPYPAIPDPYGGSDACFDHCYTVIDSALKNMARRLRWRVHGQEAPPIGPARLRS